MSLILLRLCWNQENQEAVILLQIIILLSTIHPKPDVEELPSTLRKILILSIGKILTFTKTGNKNLDLPQKLSQENTNIILMGKFNIDLMQYSKFVDSTIFLDAMYTNFILPYISAHSRIISHSKTLIDNIVTNIIAEGALSKNITTTISYHYAQFFLTMLIIHSKLFLILLIK